MAHSNRDGFSSKFGVIAAAAGSAVGLGNIWRFPYVVGENGGGAFLLLYLFFIVLIGIPVMLSELMIGRKAQVNAFRAFPSLAPKAPFFKIVGIMGVAAAFLILSFYGVVAGWTVEYIWLAVTNQLAGQSNAELKILFDTFSGSTIQPIFYLVVFMAMTAFIVRGGIQNGIEKYTKVLMPLLFVIIVVLCLRAVTLDGAMAGIEFLFKPDFSKITGDVILSALGQAFFSLSIGMGVIATYGSYISKKENLLNTAVSVSFADTLIAILSGVAIFPAVFAFGIEPGEGPGLVFVVLPQVFSQMMGGYVFAVAFFILLLIAALTSSVSLLEVVVAYFSEELKLERKKATVLAAVSITVLGVFCVVSPKLFDLFEWTSSNLLLPFGGLLIAIFVGWVLDKEVVRAELESHGKKVAMFKVIMLIVKYIAPVAVAIVLLQSLGVF
ncbi:sodium-dependent transporter [Saccharicrinis aurantiacus]|uniref:sodium-dependent transporter n=1 Tax=Saccharicrinis aurantiacus TaxID=1849719 RepID=UPI0024924AF3|nr:sodium-dependent transporter [Saccharicrinis aurantiacus]